MHNVAPPTPRVRTSIDCFLRGTLWGPILLGARGPAPLISGVMPDAPFR